MEVDRTAATLARQRSAIRRWIAPLEPRSTLVKGIAGGGKSRAAAEAIANETCFRNYWWLVPTLRRAEEQASEYARVKGAESPHEYVVRGRSAPNPGRVGENMCVRWRLAELVGRSGLSVKKKLCADCPFREGCAYLEQEKLHTLNKGLFIMAHDYATLAVCPAPSPDLVIIDESIVAKFPAHLSISPSDLEHAANSLPAHAIILRSVLHLLMNLAALRALSVRVNEIQSASNAVYARHQAIVEEVIDRGGDDAEIERAILQIESQGLQRVHRLLEQLIVEINVGARRREFNSVLFHPTARVMVDGQLESHPRITCPICVLSRTIL